MLQESNKEGSKYQETFDICYTLVNQYLNNEKDRIVSIVDPEARVAHKSPGNVKRGYKDHILVDEDSEIILSSVQTPGTDKVDLIENAELDIENITRTEITSTVRKEKRLVDPTSLREAVINAIIHNDYSNGIPPVFEIFSDKFVITSSGGLPQELSQDEFLEGISAPRNKELMRVFKDVKLLEQLGSG